MPSVLSWNQFAENDQANAVFMNAYFPHYLAKITDGTDMQIIHMSYFESARMMSALQNTIT